MQTMGDQPHVETTGPQLWCPGVVVLKEELTSEFLQFEKGEVFVVVRVHADPSKVHCDVADFLVLREPSREYMLSWQLD